MEYDIYIFSKKAKDETEAKAEIRRLKEEGISAICTLSEEGRIEFRKKNGYEVRK